MKYRKRQILLLSALLVSSTCVVGNVCASYVVNDQAGIVGIKVGIEEIANPTVSYYVPNSSGVFSISGDPVEVTTSTFNVASNAPSIPSDISNYKFLEWCTDANLTTAAGSSIEVTEDTILYAKYVGYFLSKTSGYSSSYSNQLVLNVNDGTFMYEGEHNINNAQLYKKYLKSESDYLTDCSLDGSNETHVYDTLVTNSGRYKVTLSADGKTWDIKRVVGLKFTSLDYWKAENTEKYVVYSYTEGQGAEWSDIVTSGKQTGTVWFYITPWYNSLIFVRLNNTATTPSWAQDVKWNQSGNISLTANGYSSTSYVETCTEWNGFANNFGS